MSIVWKNCGILLSNKLECIQIRAARIVSGGIIQTSYSKMLNELWWETLKERRRQKRLVMFHKISLRQALNYMLDATNSR